jgi:hypothetical protein
MDISDSIKISQPASESGRRTSRPGPGPLIRGFIIFLVALLVIPPYGEKKTIRSIKSPPRVAGKIMTVHVPLHLTYDKYSVYWLTPPRGVRVPLSFLKTKSRLKSLRMFWLTPQQLKYARLGKPVKQAAAKQRNKSKLKIGNEPLAFHYTFSN